QPQDAVSGLEAISAQRVGQPVDSLVDGGPGEPGVAADESRALRVAAAVLAQDVSEGETVQQIHGQRCSHSSGTSVRLTAMSDPGLHGDLELGDLAPRHDVPTGGRSGFAMVDGRQVHYLEW